MSGSESNLTTILSHLDSAGVRAHWPAVLSGGTVSVWCDASRCVAAAADGALVIGDGSSDDGAAVLVDAPLEESPGGGGKRSSVLSLLSVFG